MNAALINCRQAHMNPVSQLLLEINIKKRPRQQKKEQASQPASQPGAADVQQALQLLH
jgi:hypothetical protein